MVLGASLLPGTVTRQLVVWVGPSSANGKSTLGEIMRRVLGDYAGTLSADALMQQRNRATHDELLAPLVGRRWVYASEGNEGARWDTALVKLLTGADAVSLRRIYGRQELARPTWTVMLATNHVPSLGLVDPAMRDRLRLLPWDHHVPRTERVVDLAERLVEAEGPGILLWLLEGLRMVLRDGLGEPPEMVHRLTDDYFEIADDIGRYLEERTLRTPEVARQSIVASILYADYRAWCEEEGVEPVSLMRFGIRLTEEGVAKGSDARNRVTRLGIGFRECLSDATEQVVA
jgi:putative DNA primase/helicase